MLEGGDINFLYLVYWFPLLRCMTSLLYQLQIHLRIHRHLDGLSQGYVQSHAVWFFCTGDVVGIKIFP